MACEDCGMNHAPEDKAACIEGHGDDPDDPRCQGYTAGRKASGRRYYLTPPAFTQGHCSRHSSTASQ